MTVPTTRIYPTGNAFIPDVPAIEQDVPTSKLDDFLNWEPPAFTIQPPGAGTGPEATGAPKGASSDSGSK